MGRDVLTMSQKGMRPNLPCTSASAFEAQPCHPTVQHRSIDARALKTGEIDTEDNVTEQKQADLYCDSAGEQMVIAIDNMSERMTDSEGRSFFGTKGDKSPEKHVHSI